MNDKVMRIRRMAFACVLAVSAVCCISTKADEKLGGVQTGLGDTTLGGYVHSSGSGSSQSPTPAKHLGWWWDLLSWFEGRG
jgi:hypothetical protein